MPSTLGCFDDGFNDFSQSPIVSAKSMSFHSFSQNPTLFALLFAENLKILRHGNLHEKLLVSAKSVSFDGF